MTRNKAQILLLTFMLCLSITTAAGAENHALLIGIGTYRQRTLEGPPFDVAALARMLRANYGFARENIRTLVNQEAVKSRILHEIQLLAHRTRPGDRVFIYFSGHGTSRRDELMALPLPHDTGALVPADFNGSPGQSVDQLLDQLIIGKRDLRPTLRQLDRDREILMVFDTCFSGNTVRAAAAPGQADSGRYLRLSWPGIFGAEQEIGRFEQNLKSEEPYPYQNVFYISASTANEVAKDIRSDSLHRYPTIDGKPHGVLTDSLLRVLAGQRPVDTDHDGRWSQFELYTAVKSDVQRRFNQSPQALPRRGRMAKRLHARPFFVRSAAGTATAFRPPKTPAAGSQDPMQPYRLDYSFSHALVVGIDKYQRWPRLEYAAKDAREMAVLLESQGFQIHLLTDEQATLGNILAELNRIGKAVDENSRVVFYYAGHGQTEDLPGGGERGYLVPVDADEYDWRRTMLPMEELNRSFKRFRAKHILMAFDSCYSGLGLTRSINADSVRNSAYIQKMMRSRSIQILTAGSRSEQAIEAAGHGLFTDHLLAALAGTADINNDGYITATEIYATLRPSITRKSYSRQTPQFGYIEGNGDIIFRSTPRRTQPAVVSIDTATSGIDVWAGTVEIGHRLGTGRHRLQAEAGQTTIIVKKGGATLYRNQVHLSANRVFPVRIGAGRSKLQHRKAFSMRTIAGANVENYANSIAHDLDRDGREEIVTASGQSLVAFGSNGTVLWEKKFDAPITLNLIDDWNSQPAIGLTALDDDKIRLMLIDPRGDTIWQHVRKITRYHRGKPDGGGRIAKLADIDGDGRREVIAAATARHGLKHRGVMVYDQNAVELWRYAMGPSPQSIVIWPKDHGQADIIIGTYSPGNGNYEAANHTSDRQTYVISIDASGGTNWILPVGDFYNGIGVYLADPAGRGSPSLYAHRYSASYFRQDGGAIYRIDRSGDIVNQFDAANSILSITASQPAGNRPGFVYAADNQGNLYRLDERLNLVQKTTLETGSPAPEIRLVGVHDYAGGGSADLLFYSFNRLLKNNNPLAATDPQRNVFYSNLKFQIISQDFSQVRKSVSIARAWTSQRGYAVKDFERPEAAHYPFMALSDKIMVYNY